MMQSESQTPWKYWLGLVAVSILAYWNSFAGVFLWDDRNITKSGEFESLYWYANTFFIPTDRRLLQFTFTLNNIISPDQPWSFHAFNLLIHATAGLLLFAIVRKTLDSSRMNADYRSTAAPLAFIISAIFICHPLQTESVTFVVQRAQSLMGMLTLAGFYAFVSSLHSPSPRRWQVASILLLALAFNIKPHIAAIPVLIAMYDVIFETGSIREAYLRRRGYYFALALAWLFLVGNLGNHLTETGAQIGDAAPSSDWTREKISLWAYTRSQFGVMLHYLYLFFAPTDLCLDYMWPVAETWQEILLPGVAATALLALNIWALLKHAAWGFVGAWYILQLAPTTLTPRPDLAVEHRLYLPLAALAELTVLLLFHLSSRIAAYKQWFSKDWRALLYPAATAGIVALICLTLERNTYYYSQTKMYADVVRKSPKNPRGYSNLAYAQLKEGKFTEAMANAKFALELHPNLIHAHKNLAACHAALGQYAQALAVLKSLEESCSKDIEYHYSLSWIYKALGEESSARAEMELAVQCSPRSPLAAKIRRFIQSENALPQ